MAPSNTHRWLNVLLGFCLLMTFFSVAGLAGGHLSSLEMGVGAGFGMIGMGMWSGTLYLVALGEDGWWWFELKNGGRLPLGSGGYGFRWIWDPSDSEYGIGIPLWLTTALLLWLTCALWKWRRRTPVLADLCGSCGYDLRATPPGRRCPECGTITTARAAKAVM